jgi:rod shape-determining protein MreD
MIVSFFKNLVWFITLALMQMLVFNHIHVMGYATPLVYIYLLIMFPRGTTRTVILLWGFCLGLIVDIVANTPGVATGSLTLAALLQQPLLGLFTSKEDPADIAPSFATMENSSYIGYVTCMVIVQQVAFFALEAFSFFNWVDVALSAVSSSVLTILLVLAIDGARSHSNKE